MTIASLFHIKWYTQQHSSYVVIMMRQMSNDEGDNVRGRFFLLQQCIGEMMTQQYRQQSRCWWRVLSIFAYPGLWIHIAEHALSLPSRTPSFVFSLCCHSSLLVGDPVVSLSVSPLLSCAFTLWSFPHLSHSSPTPTTCNRFVIHCSLIFTQSLA